MATATAGSPHSLWHHPDFLKLWTGQAISQIGSRISREGLPYTAALVLNASPFQMGLLSGIGAGGVWLFGLFAGAWVDRLRRRPVMIATDLGRAIVLATVPLAAWMGWLSIHHLYFVAAATGILTLLFDVAYQAYLPSLVEREHILEGNSRLALTESIAEIAGTGGTGVLVQVLTAPFAILLDAISFVCSAVSVWLIRKPEPAPIAHPNPDILREISAGLRACWQDPILRALAGRTATAAFFWGVPSSLYLVFAIRDLKLSPAMLGAVIATGGVSSLVGALVAEPLVKRLGFGRTFIASATVTALAGLLVPMAHGPAWMACAYLVASQLGDISWATYNINEVTLRQAIAPAHLLGRVNSAMHLLFRGLLPFGALAGGALAEALGVRTALLIGAIGATLSVLWLVFSPVRRLARQQFLSQ